MKLVRNDGGFTIWLNGREVLEHSKGEPLLAVGQGKASYKMSHGVFNVKDRLAKKVQLEEFEIDEDERGIRARFWNAVSGCSITLRIDKDGEKLALRFMDGCEGLNRLWLRIRADEGEHIYGCGEQFTEFDLKGKRVKVWVSEHQGVKRLISKVLSRKIGIKKDKNRDFEQYTTYYCCPLYLSSRKYFLYVNDSSYMEFDFRNKNYNEICIFNIPGEILIAGGDSFEVLYEGITGLLGRQYELPGWVYDGIILGVQGGTDTVMEKLHKAEAMGVHVSAIWPQDWQGRRITAFGKQLMWNWKWDEELYPGLDKKIENLKEQGIRFLGYINPFLAIEGGLYREASSKGYTVKDKKGKDYLVKITTFPAAMVDLTNPEAYEWIKGVIKRNMIDFGLSGWMADFGEYLPADAVLYGDRLSEEVHNMWPVLWAKANREAVEESGRMGDVVFFTRSGFSGTPGYSSLMWTGDQHVDCSYDDGMASVIPALLSLSVCGCGLSHSDIGGYTTLPGINRSKETFMRWAEMAAFTPVMRTHEGNRPDDNWQFDSDDETLYHTARMTEVYRALSSYLKDCDRENAARGIPVIRPLFTYYDEDRCYRIKYEYLLGRDVLVSPVLEEGRDSWRVYLPEDDWIHIWSGKKYKGGEIVVESPMGYPPVFYRESSRYRDIFQYICKL